MQLKTIEDLNKLRELGKVQEATQEPNIYITVYRYTPEEIAPLFNFVEKILGEGFYQGKRSNKGEK